MSIQDLIGDVLRTVIPTVMATTGLQYQLRSSAAGVLPPVWGSAVALVGQLEKKGSSQTRDESTGALVVRHRARVTVADTTVTLVQGTKVGIAGQDPYGVSDIEEGHIIRPGLITYNLLRDVPTLANGGRPGGGI